MNEIENISSIEYSYKIDPNEEPITTNVESNPTTTQLIIGELEMIKTVDKE